jgi:GGDEF domain-containing protein
MGGGMMGDWDTPPTAEELAAANAPTNQPAKEQGWDTPPTAEELAAANAPTNQKAPNYSAFDKALQGQQAERRSARDEADHATEASYTWWQAQNSQKYSPGTMAEARQYSIAKPQYDLDYIAQNLDKVREEVRADGINWEKLQRDHPTLTKYLRDPGTATQVLQDSATLTDWHRIIGGTTSDGQYTAPPWASELKDAFTEGLKRTGAGTAEFVYDANDYFRTPTSQELAAKLTHEPAPPRDDFSHRYWQSTVERLKKDTKDYAGGDVDPTTLSGKAAHVLDLGLSFAARSAPLLVASALGGGVGAAGAEAKGLASAAAIKQGASRGVLLVNSLYSVGELYPEMKEATGGDTGVALGATALGAPIMGKMMGWSPVSGAAGSAISGAVDEGMVRAAAKAASSGTWMKFAAATAKKVGLDFLMGKTSFAAQSAASAAITETAKTWAGKPADFGKIIGGAQQGWESGDAAWLMSAYSTGRHAVAEIGRAARGRETSRMLTEIMQNVAKSTMAQQDPSLHEQILKGMAAGSGNSTVYLPLDRFNEEAQRLKMDPRELAVSLDLGDQHHEASMAGAYDLPVPVEKLHKLAKAKLGDLVAQEGKFDPKGMSGSDVDRAAEAFQKAREYAQKTAPEKMTSEERAVYEDARTHVDSKDAEAYARSVLGAAKGLHTRMPERQLMDVYRDTFGAGGLYNEEARPPTLDERGSQYFMSLPVDKRAVEAFHDPVTGLMNEAGFRTLPPDNAKPLVAHVSMEGLKWAQDNSAAGHATGNGLLRAAAHALAAVEPDTAKTNGGDFAFRAATEAEARRVVGEANAKLPKELQGFKLTVATGDSLEAAGEVHGKWKDAEEKAGRRAQRGQRPQGVPKSVEPGSLQVPAKPVEQAPRAAHMALAESDVSHQAYRDGLTGLLTEKGSKAVGQGGHRLAIDVDGLKISNKMGGQALGNAVLQHFGDALSGLGGDAVYATHLHGDEFAGSHGVPELLHQVAGELTDVLKDVTVSYIDPKSGEVVEQKGIKFSFGVGATDEAAESALKAHKESRAAAGERGADITAGSITRRPTTADELERGRASVDQVRGHGGVGAGDVDGRAASADEGLLAPADQRIIQTEIERGREAARVTEPQLAARALFEDPAEYDKKVAAARDTAQKRALAAIMVGHGRSFIVKEHTRLQAQAEEEIKSDPVYRAQHFFQTGELRGNTDQLARLTSPDGKPLRFLDKDLAERFPGSRVVEELKQKRGLVTSDPRQAVDIDVAADVLGFKGDAGAGGDHLVVSLRDALPEREATKQLADLKMEQLHHPALLDEPKAMAAAVLDAVHNEKVAPKLLAEMGAMARKLDPTRQARMKVTPEMWQDFAHRMISGKALSEVDPEIYSRTAARKSQEAAEALAAGNVVRAFDATEAQLMNHYLYREARDQSTSIQSMFNKLAERATSDRVRAIVGKGDPAYRQLHDAVLGALGFTDPQGADPRAVVQGFQDAIEKNGQAENLALDRWTPEGISPLLSGEKTWADLKPEEARQVFDALKNIEHISKLQTEKLAGIRAADREALITSAARYISGLAPGVEGPPRPTELPVQDTNSIKTKAAKNPLTSAWGGAYLDTPRLLLKRLGPEVSDRVYGGFLDARNKAREMFNNLYLPWKETQKNFEADPDRHKVLTRAEELVRIPGMKGMITKGYLTQLMKWMGSESGREKALKGTGLVADKVFEAAAKYLKPADLEAIQAEHKFFAEKLWPLKAAAHEARTGLPLEEVAPMSYTVPFADGPVEYDGGYYPVHWDQRPGVAKQVPHISVDAVGTAQAGRPSVPDGSFQARTGYTGIPDFNWNNYPQHLLADIHNLAFGDFVQDASKLLMDPSMQGVMAQGVGEDYAKQTQGWLWRVATESAGSVPGYLRDVSNSFRQARSSLVTGALGFSLPVLAAHLGHPLATAAMRDGAWFTITYAAPSMGRVLESAASELTTGSNPVREFALANSQELAQRADTLREQMTSWFRGTYIGEPGYWEGPKAKIHNAAFWHLHEMDKLMSTMIWDAKYRHTLDTTQDHAKAVSAADEQVRAAMPNFSTMEMPAIMAEKHNLIAASMLTFHSYYAKLYEMAAEGKQAAEFPFREAQGVGGKASKAVSYSMWAGRAVGMLTFGTVMGSFLKGKGKEPDEDWQTWLLRKELSAPTEMFPYAAALSEPIIDAAVKGTKPRDIMNENPYFGPTVGLLRAVEGLLNARKPDEDKVVDMVKASLMVGGAPAVGPVRAAKYGYDWATGEAQPRGAWDAVSGFMYGKKTGWGLRHEAETPLTLVQKAIEENGK